MPETDRLVVQAPWINDAEFIGYFAAMAAGHYERVGISVEHRPGYSGIVPETALIDGTATIALSSPDSVATTVAHTGADLRIVGAQFRKSPLSLISSASAPLRSMSDLIGKTIAVPSANRALMDWLIEDADLDHADVALVDYDHDATKLLNAEVTGFVDFAADCTFLFQRKGHRCHVVPLHDLGARLFNNVVVVTAACLADHQDMLNRWLAASRQGWRDNARNLEALPASLRDSYLTGGRTLDAEIHANRTFSALMGEPDAYFNMGANDIAQNRRTLAGLGLKTDNLFCGLG